MKTFLITMLGVVAGVAVLGAIAFFWIRRKLKGLGASLGEALKQMAAACGVPPFAITLKRGGEIEWRRRLEVDGVSRHFEAAGYLQGDDYTIPEMPDVRLRSLWHPNAHSFAVVYDHDEAGVFADVVRFFRDGGVLTVTSAPETGMDYPDYVQRLRLDVDLGEPAGAQMLHEAMLAESASQAAIPATMEHFPRAFIGAYALELDWRIERGGPSAEEIRAVARVSGQDEPDADAIALVQDGWRGAIASHKAEETQRVFLQCHPMSAQEWELKRERVRIINDWLEAEALIDELAWTAIAGSYDAEDDEAEERAHGAAVQRLKEVFANTTPRRGFQAAQALLPEKSRFEHLSSVEKPPGDVYLEPESHDAAV